MLEMREELPWYKEWLWVGSYSSFSTLIIIFNMMLVFSVGKNKYLYFSFHYVMLALAIRNIVRVGYSLLLLILSKVIATDWLYKMIYRLPANAGYEADSLRQYSGLSNTCQVLSIADNFLMTVVMIYIASLAVYLLCRPSTVKPFGAAESCWLPTVLLSLPPLLSCLASLPAPFLGASKPLTPLPLGDLCRDNQQKSEVVTYLTSLCILGYLLPLTIIICSTLVLIIRRCVNCGKCSSSHCREELSLVLVSTIFTLSQLAMYLPIFDYYLAKFELPTSDQELGEYLTPELSRGLETLSGLVFPLILYMTLPAYRSFSTVPDEMDLILEDAIDERENSEPPHCVTRLSQSSLDMVSRNGYFN